MYDEYMSAYIYIYMCVCIYTHMCILHIYIYRYIGLLIILPFRTVIGWEQDSWVGLEDPSSFLEPPASRRINGRK